MKASDYMIDLMVQNGIDRTWVFQGGAISHVIDSAYLRHQKDGSIRPYTVMHEQSGSMAADAYTRITGKVASVMVTSGPGATNLITGIACSWYDSVPGLYLTGQVRTWECKTGEMRQLGFQETDIVSIVEPITKYAKLITDPRDIRYEFEKALWLATTGRPGPVLLDLPMDIQWAEVDPSQQRPFIPPEEKWNYSAQNATKLSALAEILNNAKRPVILSGAGIRNSGAEKQLIEFAEKYNIPVTVSFGGKDSISHQHKLFCGLIGAMGNEESNETLHSADLILALGTRLSWRQIRMTPDKFVPDAKIIHVDIDASEHNQHIPAVMNFSWDCSRFISELNGALEGKSLDFSEFALARKQAYEACSFFNNESFEDKNAVHPHRFFNALSKNSADDDIYVADTGQNLVWSMQGLDIRGTQRIITAWGHSPMGYSIAAALGPATIPEQKRVICLSGDGGIQLNIQELQTICIFNLPIVIFILNNHSYGAIKDFQDGNLEGRHFATGGEYDYQPPDFVSVTNAYGIPTARLSNEASLDEQIKEILSNNGPILVEVDLGSKTDMVLSLVKG